MPSDLGRDRGSRACGFGRISSAPGSTDNHRAGGIGAHLSSTDVVEFLRAFPDIRMRVSLTDRYLNLVEEHVDRALRIGELADSSTIGTRVGSIRLVLCASPAYLKKRGTPKQPADLAAHDCVVQEDHPTPQNWKFFTDETTQTIQVPSRLAVNLGEAAESAATAGAGIACTLSYLVDDLVKSGSLVKLLGAYESPPTPVSVIYPSRRQVPRKLRAFLDFSIPRLRQRLGYNNT